MSENVNISFIPKKSLSRSDEMRRRPITLSLSVIIAVTISFCIIGYATYQYFEIERLTETRATLLTEIEEDEKEINGKDAVKKLDALRDTVRQIELTKDLLNKHVALSGLFEYISTVIPGKFENTQIDPVIYSSFSYERTSTGEPRITMNGQAFSYGVLATLSRDYQQRSEMKEFSLGGFSLNKDGVGFTFSTTLDPKIISYNSFVRGEKVFSTNLDIQ